MTFQSVSSKARGFAATAHDSNRRLLLRFADLDAPCGDNVVRAKILMARRVAVRRRRMLLIRHHR